MATQGAMLSTLTTLEAHLLLALSSGSHLLVSLPSADLLASVFNSVRSFSNCTQAAVSRSSHIVPLEQRRDALDAHADVLLSHFFTTVDGVDTLPEILVIPFIDHLPRSSQAILKDVLRDKRFVLEGHSWLLPKGFICVGVMCEGDFENAGLSRHLVDYFGLSISLFEDDLLKPSSQNPPLIPARPALHSAPKLTTYASDLLSGLRHHPSLHAYLLTNRCSAKHVMEIANLWCKLKRARSIADDSDTGTGRVEYPTEGDIRPEDVREVLLSCVGHRMRLREEKERLSNFWGAPHNQVDHGKDVQEIVQDVLRLV